ncbi:MAG: hypothetical protein ABSB35_26900 [Bryobacteraceae bacterium]
MYFLRPAKALLLIVFCLLLASGSVALAQQYTISTFAGGSPPPTPVAALNTSIGPPQRVAMDSSGNLYFGSLNCVFKISPSGQMTLVAGTSRPGYSGDGGPAVKAQLNEPQGLAVDASGNLYIADSLNSVIRMVSPSGIINTIAGNGTPGYSGDGGLATQAQLQFPGGIAIDNYGNIDIADTTNNVIRQVFPGGNIITFAGVGVAGYAGDGAPATAAYLSHPADVAVDPSGNVYIADTENAVIRQVTTDNNIHTFAGDNTLGSSGDGGISTNAQLTQPQGVASDSSGNIYIAEYGDGRVRKVTVTKTVVTSGTISTIAGNGLFGFSGDGGAATSAMLAGAWSLTVDSSGNVYVADLQNYRIRKISGTTISTIAGNGLYSYSGDGGLAATSEMNAPHAVAVDAKGNVYVADTNNDGVRAITPQGLIYTLAGDSAPGYGGDNGPSGSAQLNHPQGVAVDAAGNVYIADTINERVRVVSPTGVISTFAGSGKGGYGGDGGPATSALMNQPRGLALDSSGNLYIADFYNSVVRKVSKGIITTVAGIGTSGFSGDGGQATAAQLFNPVAVAVDALGNLYISDSGNYRIRVVSPKGIINTIAGNGTSVSTGDGGLAVNAQLAAPAGIVVDAAGNIYFSDGPTRIRKIGPDGTISTIAGNGSIGYSGDGGPAAGAQFNALAGLALGAANNIYVADAGNNAIRLLQPVSFNLTIGSVVNSASLAGGPVAPGETVVVFGSGLGPAQLQQAPAGTVPTTLAGTRVLFNGVPGPVLYTWTTQVAAVVPFATTGTNVQVQVQYQSQTSTSANVTLAPVAPGLFTMNSSGQGQALVFNSNGSLNSASNPASPGSTISLFATGLGVTSPAGVDGSLNPSGASDPQPVQKVTATVAGQGATVTSAVGAPGLVAGVTQVNVQVPTGIPPGAAVPVFVQAGGASSQTGVTIAVGGS